MGKKIETVTPEHVIEAEERSLLDHKNFLILLSEPYLFLTDHKLDRLTQAINILATKKGYRVLNQSIDAWNKNIIVCMEKQK